MGCPFFYIGLFLIIFAHKDSLFVPKYSIMDILRKIWKFYYDGFREMTVGKTLWLLIVIKLFVMFSILKLFFFKSELGKYETDEEKSKVVIENLIN